MGVPSFFRWLSRKYPKIISPVLEEQPQVVDGVILPSDYSAPNPNGELDNLYLDMNGIVHPCSHPENKPPPETEDEMLLAVFEYTNRVLNMARPRKVLVMAVDGVAPRAKMNQQRARRFRSARDAQIENEAREEIMRQREEVGEIIDDAIRNKKTWDSNAITPGTPFMDKLAAALRYWTAFKLATDPGWKNLQVIISDATVPGEGEHKIMNFIRSQRADPEYNPNTTHCIYGLDADLIFLGLATHEPHFKILREDVFAQDNRKRNNFKDTINMTEEEKQFIQKQNSEQPFLWLHINVLREYLSAELWVPGLPFTFDLERAIDDWVFMCFFCGNDFLPHLPCLDVRENSIDILLDIWKVVLPRLKTYMTCDGVLNLPSVETLLQHLGSREGDIFKTRHIQEARKKEAFERRKAQKNMSKGQDRHPIVATEQLQMYDTQGNLAKGSWNLTTSDMVRLRRELMLANEGNEEAIAKIKEQSDKNNEIIKDISKEEIDDAVNKANRSNFNLAEVMKQKLINKKHRLENDKEEEEETAKESKKVKAEKAESEDNLDAEIKSEIVADVDDREESETTRDSSVRSNIVVSEGPQNGVFDTDEYVKLFEPGYHERYYTAKFRIPPQNIDQLRKDMVKCYIEGVAWVLTYYYQGCASWNWFYPYHYAPLATDFHGFSHLEIKFEEGTPFLPYEQLMSVLPAASGHALPKIFRSLMSEPDSEIVDFYPEEFPIDMNGKKMSWQGIALLPFIDQDRLLAAVRAQYPLLSDAERARNVRGEPVLLISDKNANYERFSKKLYSKDNNRTIEVKFQHFRSGLSGIVSKDVEGFELNGKMVCPIQGGSLPDLSTSLILKMSYRLIPLPSRNKSIILNGFIPSESVLTAYDLDSIMYKYNNQNYSRRWNFGNDMKQNIVPVGPKGITQYKPRTGGYRAFFYFAELRNNTQPVYNHSKSGYHTQSGSNNSRYNTGNNSYRQNSSFRNNNFPGNRNGGHYGGNSYSRNNKQSRYDNSRTNER